MNKNRVLSMLGLATKAGKVAFGSETCEKAIQAKKAYLIILASDAAFNTQKKFRNKAAFYNLELIDELTKSEINETTGKQNKTVAIITDKNLAKKILDITLNP